jgi:hypothetical protein
VDRAQQDTAARERVTQADAKAESAAGVGTADEDQAAGERDADGRRLWERPPAKEDVASEAEPPAPCPVKDVTGAAGNQLDLTG